MLEIGTKAPDFTLEDQNGEKHSLSDYEGKKLYYTFIQKIIRLAAPIKLFFYGIKSWIW